MNKLCCLTAAALAVLAWQATAHAASHRWLLPGDALTVATPCAKTVSIVPSTTLHGEIRITAEHAAAQELAGLTAAGGTQVTLTGRGTQCDAAGNCVTHGDACPGGWFLLGHGRRMVIDITVPAGTAVTIDEAGATDYRIGTIGALHATLAGAGSLSVDNAAALAATLSGSGDLFASKLSGTLLATLAGSGELAIERADTSRAKLTLTGTGDAMVTVGSLGAVTAVLAGGGDFTGPDARSLQLSSTGTGNARLHDVDGPVHAALLGGGDLSLGRVTGDVTTERGGPGDLAIRDLAGRLIQTGYGGGGTRVHHA
jgi:hypothetical protein